MATISELNVRLGLLYKDFDSSLRKVERDLERSGRKFSQLGNDLSLAVSLPLAALGASAIKQAGEIESLKLAMTSTFEAAGRSAAEATAEVEALRQAAKAPGLDFEQAVRGSIRLQGVGLAAEEARRILEQMANAIASTGGTAEDLDGVTRQFSQMIAKGRVLQEDVSILAERMPVIATLMQRAFGTASVEAIRASGVSAKEFVARITEAASALPRVEGGIKNALVNAAAEARNSLATLGEEIVKTFDVKGKLDDFTVALQGAVQWFKNLSEGTKEAIIQIGLVAIVAGPAIKVFGALYGGAAQLVSMFGSLVSATKGVALFMAGATKSTATLTEYTARYVVTLRGATLATDSFRKAFIGATLGLSAILLGIAAAVALTADNFDAATYTAETFAKASSEVREESAKEIGVLNKNIDVLKNVASSTDDRKKAADDLLKAYPDYLRGVDLEKASLAQLKEIQDQLTGSIIRNIAERKKASAVNALYEKQADILLRIQEIQRSGKITTGEATLIDTGDLIRNGSNAAAVIEKLKQQVSDLGKQATVTASDFDKAFGLQTRAIDLQLEKEYAAREAAEELRSEYSKLGGQYAKNNAATKEGTAATQAQIDAAKKQADAYKNILKSIDAVNKKQAELGADFVGEKTKEIEAGVEKLIEAGFAPNSGPVQKLKGYLQQIRQQIAVGFGSANAAQAATGASPAAPAALPTLQPGTSLASGDFGVSPKGVSGQTEAIAKALALGTQQAAIFNTALIGSQETWAAWITQVQESQEYLKSFWDANGAAMNATGDAIIALGESIATTMDKGAKSFKTFARDALNAIADVIAALIKQAVAAAIANAFKSSGNPIIGAALAAVGGALAAAVFKKLVGAATFKAFASGGVVSQPTLGLVGEYAGASRNPEIITPERLMRTIFREEAGAGMGDIRVYGELSAEGIHIANIKGERRRERGR